MADPEDTIRSAITALAAKAGKAGDTDEVEQCARAVRYLAEALAWLVSPEQHH